MYNSLILNVVLFVFLFLGVTVVLYYRYEHKRKNHHSYEAIKTNALLQKMMNLETFNNKEDDMLTSLPIFSSTL